MSVQASIALEWSSVENFRERERDMKPINMNRCYELFGLAVCGSPYAVWINRRSSSRSPTTVVKVTISTTEENSTALITPAWRAVVAKTSPGNPRGISPNTTTARSTPEATSCLQIPRAQAALLSRARAMSPAPRAQALGSSRAARGSRIPTLMKYKGRNTSVRTWKVP